MKIYPTLLGCLLSCFFSNCLLSAEELVNPTNPPLDIRATSNVWQESVYDLKRSAQALLDENNALTTEKENFTQAATQIQEDILRVKKDTEKLTQEPARLNPLISAKQEKNGALSRELEGLRHEITVTGQSHSSLSQELSSLRERHRPLAEQRTHLLERKTTLELDVTTGQSASEKETEAVKASIEDLKNKISEYEAQKNDTADRISQSRQDYDNLIKEIQQLKEKNKTLFGELSVQRENLEQGNRELASLRESEAGGDLDSMIWDKKTRQKQELEEQVKQLEGQVATALTDREAQKAKAATQDDQREQLRQQITDSHVDNKMLQSKIADFKSVIDILKKENAMIEALLQAE